jgi:hypothetical protein
VSGLFGMADLGFVMAEQVPFARYIAQYNPGNFKRFHIAKVYR